MENAASREVAKMGVEVASATDLGLKRTQNEDSHSTWIPSDPAERRRRGVLLVVADGMGGSRAGEVASRLAVQTVMRSYREAPGENPLEDLFRAIEAANQVVHHESATHPELAGMGTTCTAIVVRDADAFFAHVGDSRAYLVQEGRIRQLTRDHSLVAQLVRDGQLTSDQAKVDPRRNVVTRSVGVGPHVEIDADHEPGMLREGDTLLLCTDGLHGLVADEELKAAAMLPDMEEGCRQAIALANQRGGPDNITVVMGRMTAQGARAGAGDARVDRDRGTRNDASSGVAAPRRIEPRGSAARDAAAPQEERFGAATDDGLPRPYSLREDRRRSSASVTLWLIVALAVLAIAVAAMAFVLHRLGQESKHLGSQQEEARLAWR
jgi:serine/threonine protein phosphatase PrpC